MRAARSRHGFAADVVGGVVLFDAVRLGFGWGPDGPRSGFFPFGWPDHGVLLPVILVQAVLHGAGKSFVSRKQLAPVLTVLWPAVAAVAIMRFVGLYVASALYIGFYMRWVGRHSGLAVFALGIGIPVIAFLIFEKWFLVPMPKGPLEHWLGY
jgi:hypothetical protein